ncbi:hypothetical protein HZB03_01245 [Candidatus Woesearchaeota archaeon]|nr:hypothetical protein [Candidatus Woesearchaeota archaeon]
MEFKQLISLVTEQKDYQDWKCRHPNAALVHVFVMVEPNRAEQYDVGYYDQTTKQMASFTVTRAKEYLGVHEHDEILKDPKHQIKPLVPDDVHVELMEALDIAVKLQQHKYKKDIALKHVLILQKLPIGQVWNITFVTQQFQTLNIKINAKTGKVIEDSLQPLFQFGPDKKR